MARTPKNTGDGPEGDPSQSEPTWIGTERAKEISRNRGGGDGDGTGLESRVSRLEAFVEITHADVREIRSDLKAIISTMGNLPKKSDLDAWKWQWLAASVAIFAIVITSILGGLSFLTK